jgi:hypothetical protein
MSFLGHCAEHTRTAQRKEPAICDHGNSVPKVFANKEDHGGVSVGMSSNHQCLGVLSP